MKIKWCILTQVLLTIFLASCVSANSITTTSSVQQRTEESQASQIHQTPTYTLSPEPPTLSNTATSEPQTQIPEDTITPTIPPEAHLTIQCLEINNKLPPDLRVEGLILLDSIETYDAQFLNLGTGDQTQINHSNENPVDFAVSPDGLWVAYRLVIFEESSNEVVERRLNVMNPTDQQVLSIPWEEEWTGISKWQDQERLIISLKGEAPTPMLLLNPFTGERQEINDTFPELEGLDRVPYWDKNYGRVYDPSMTRVVLAGLGDIYQPNNIRGFEYIQKDLQTNQTLATLPTFDYITHTPKWSPDGRQVLIATLPDILSSKFYEIFSISREGQIVRLTYLSAYYESGNISRYSWSPDGRYIAFWLVAEPSQYTDERLAVLDTLTQEVKSYCLPGDFGGPPLNGETAPVPLWSHNGDQLLIENRISEKSTRIILVDLVEELAVQISENTRPRGWLQISIAD